MLDKIAVREMLAQYKSWNAQEEVARVEDARKLSPIAAMRRYVELWNLCIALRGESPQPPPARDDLLAYVERAGMLSRKSNGA
jgi:hypothetical protein